MTSTTNSRRGQAGALSRRELLQRTRESSRPRVRPASSPQAGHRRRRDVQRRQEPRHHQLPQLEGYDLQPPMKAWRKQNGVKLNTTFINTQEDVLSKLRSGGTADVSTYFTTFYDRMRELDLLSRSTERIPNFTGPDGPRPVSPALLVRRRQALGRPPRDAEPALQLPGRQDGRAEVVGRPPGSEAEGPRDADRRLDAGDPDRREGPRARGEDPQLHEGGVAKIVDFLKKIRQQARTVSSYGDAENQLGSGDVWVTFVGYALITANNRKKGIDVRHVWPKEGGMAGSDIWFIPKGAKNIDGAYAFINESLSTPVQKYMADNLIAGPVNNKALVSLNGDARRPSRTTTWRRSSPRTRTTAASRRSRTTTRPPPTG